MNHQKTWRRIATGLLLAAAVMAIYSISTDLMRDSLVFLVKLFSETAGEINTRHPLWFCLAYWSVFAAFLLTILYIAMLDIRYIRLQFALGKQELIKQSWENEEFRKMLKKTQQKKD